MTAPSEPIARHRTALKRSTLSSPFRCLVDMGFLDGRRTVFDYGCGRGDDLRLLADMGIDAEGWDPVYRPNAARRLSDIVNLGFVLNVIDDPEERRQTLKAAWQLAREALIVSVMLAYEAHRRRFDAHGDGVRTQRNTFQKYFSQDEFRAYIEDALDTNVIALAPGIGIVFRDPLTEQLFLAARQQVRREWRLLRRDLGAAVPGAASGADTGAATEADTRIGTGAATGSITGVDTGAATGAATGADTRDDAGAVTGADTGADARTATAADTGAATGIDTVAAKVERHRPTLDAYWTRALELGRPPVAEECPEGLALASLVGTWRRVHDWAAQFFQPEELEAASIARQEDLLVHFALSHFNRRRAYRRLPSRLQRDARFFFGGAAKARAAGRRALFAVADRQRVLAAASFCHEELGIGRLNGEHDLAFHCSLLGECLPLIRIYVGCALALFGDVGAADLIKVHLQSSKVTFLRYDDFHNGQPALLVERVKVDLARQRVGFFDYRDGVTPEPLEGEAWEYGQR